MGTVTNTMVTAERADALIEAWNMTDAVEDYEQNELGHVYTLPNGNVIIVAIQTCTAELEADQLLRNLNLADQVNDYELNDYAFVYPLENGNTFVVIASGR